MTNIYAKRNYEAQGEHYLRHIDRMTVENLHSKSDIAGELAHRDIEIESLRQLLKEALEQIEDDWERIDGEWGPTEGGLAGGIARGKFPLIAALRKAVGRTT